MNSRAIDTVLVARSGSALPPSDGLGVTKEPSVATAALIVESAVATSARQPVTVGVPWPRGVVMDGLSLSLADPSGRNVPLQTSPLAHWSDASVQWLLVDFLLDPIVAGGGSWTLDAWRPDSARPVPPDTQLRLHENEREIVVATGAATFRLDRTTLAPIVQAEIDGVPVLDATRTQTVLKDARGRSCLPCIERSEIEARGPVRATVCLEGSFEGRRRQRLRFRARLSFFAGSSLAGVELTVHNPRRARHRGGLWDLGDPGSTFFRDLSLQLGMHRSGPRQIRWTEDVDGSISKHRSGHIRDLSRLQRRRKLAKSKSRESLG